MELFLFIAAIVVAWFVLKKIMKGNPASAVSKSCREWITAEYKNVGLLNTHPETGDRIPASSDTSDRTQ
ncbi:hypothetical protein D8682_09435 [Buttiauxella sp. 3AFRM03]|uniref:hypothetical protein n=1 Tax=Buttiauxella sp. 3AFRM03 TaxID=2479367 RepID=UPI000EF760A1|nr:hypothetical protein [Buttiauxella sp. 3AFRM03]AYN27178.1 hypothetical protein D8682_09435 [Buttiauxella sp. 3AFRM03]